MRLSRRADLLLLVLIVCAAPARAQAPRHPLDGLSAQEHWVLYDVLRDSGHIDGKTRWAGVTLREPAKAEVLAWKSGDPLARQAAAVIVQGPKTFEAVVNLSARRLASWKEIRGVQPSFRKAEFEEQDELVKSNPEVLAALKRRGITDLATVSCEGPSPGYFGGKEEEGRRLALATCANSHGTYNWWTRPISGLTILIDLNQKKILRVSDSGPVPVPAGPVDYDPEGVGKTRQELAPLRVEQPLGPGFRLDGGEVSWDRWRFHVRIDPRRGLVVSQVRYADGQRLRSVLYQGSLSEIFVPYMDPEDPWYTRTFLDMGEFGPTLELARRTLVAGGDCPGNAAFLDVVLANDRGVPERISRVACLFERAGGEVAWRHAEGETGVLESRARRDLVVRLASTFGNYDYVFDWIFQQDGSIRGAVGSTGIAEVKGVKSRNLSAETASRDGAYGRFVAENTVAVNHDHFFNYRLDLDVDGTANSLVVDEIKAKRLPETNLRKSLWVVEPRMARFEKDGQLDRHAPALWRVVNAAAKGPLGYPTSYEIKPGHSAESLLAKDDFPQRRAGFTDHALWVTPYRPDELYPAGDYVTQSRGGDGLPAWTSANRPVQNTDIVLWHTFGMHHVVRAEDWPVMPTVWHEFELRPFDFFPRNPALDLPRPP